MEEARSAKDVMYSFWTYLERDEDQSIEGMHATPGAAARWRERLHLSRADCARMGVLSDVYRLSDGSYVVRSIRRRRSLRLSRLLSRLRLDRVFVFRAWEIDEAWQVDLFDQASSPPIEERIRLG
ncbi:MAG: hypothetical protein ACHQ01_01650 [Candidatus Limnocylindrales bacterium]